MLRSPQRFFSTTIRTTGTQTATVPNQLLIGGKWVDSTDRKTFDVEDPATGKVIAQCAAASKKDIDLAVQAASDCYHSTWKNVPHFQRAVLMNKFADEILKHADELVHIECTDNGKAKEIAAKDVKFASMILRYNAGSCERLDGVALHSDVG